MHEKCKVLCVDDHADTCFMMKHLLGLSDYEVEVTDTIESAVELASERSFDLFILDRRFPDGAGVDLCVRLRSIAPETPIVFYTGDGYQLHRNEALDAGADAYILKPQIEELLETVNHLLVERDCMPDE